MKDNSTIAIEFLLYEYINCSIKLKNHCKKNEVV